MDTTPINLPTKDTPTPPVAKPISLPKKEDHGGHGHTGHGHNEEESSSVGTKVFAVIGLAGLLALLSFGIVKIAPGTFKFLTGAAVSLSTKFIPGNNNPFTAGPLALTSDKTSLNSGDAFTLGWAPKKDEAGSYTISYPCTNGFHLEAPQEGDNMILTCDTEYAFTSDVNTLNLVAFSLQSRVVEVPITLNFIKEEGEEPTYSSDITITVTNPSQGENENIVLSPKATPAISPTPTKTTSPLTVRPRATVTPSSVSYVPPAQTVPLEDPYGKSDLVINIIKTGVVSRSTGDFTPKDEIRKTEQAGVLFEVMNIGTKKSGVWTFESQLPTKISKTFNSGNQVSLMPGDKVQFVLGFDEFQDVSTLSFSIKVDPERYEDELKENNNIGFVNINVKE